MFKTVQDEYESEGIEWKRISFQDNQPVLDMLESRMGVLSLINEECLRPKVRLRGIIRENPHRTQRNKDFKIAGRVC